MLFHDDEHHFVIAAEKCHFVALLSPFNGDEFFPELLFFFIRQNFDNSLISQHYLIIYDRQFDAFRALILFILRFN